MRVLLSNTDLLFRAGTQRWVRTLADELTAAVFPGARRSSAT